ncbi:PAS domain S-box-containing protein [Methanoculleus thermophilus]|jgi:PAS domain S-box-containing protein|uniref:PAS domain S-box-containing protein n=2 Tax=Methanomicrobiaceae TaxID=2194 RepID=A0A1G8WQW0_9EURY|nr:PAS domain S-box-containing protein [Methanoculleus thermophilus]
MDLDECLVTLLARGGPEDMDPHTANGSPKDAPAQQPGGRRDCERGADALTSATGSVLPGLTATMLWEVIKTSLSGICIADGEGRIVFVNASLLGMWGYGRQEMIGRPLDHLWSTPGEGLDCIGRALSAGQWSGRITARRRDSTVFDARISISTFQDPGTAAPWLIISCLDVSARRVPHRQRSLEEALAAMPERFLDLKEMDRAIEQSLEDLGRGCGACRAYLSLFNSSRTLLGTTHEWRTPEQRSRRGEFQKFLSTDLPWWVEQILDGETVHLGEAAGRRRSGRDERDLLKRSGATEILMIPILLREAVVGFVGFDRNTENVRFTDDEILLLTAAAHLIASALDRKQSEYTFRESEGLYQIVLDSITDTVTVVDTGLTLLLANEAFIAWCEDLGLSTDVVGRNLFDVLPFLPPSARQQYERVIRTGRPLTSERSLTLNGQVVVLREMRIPIFEEGEVAMVITITRDITAQKEVEELKSKAYGQIERNMEQFALLADHIRNPLQAIMGRAELLDDAETTEKIRQQVQRINAIIDQLDERWAESRKLSMFWRKYS